MTAASPLEPHRLYRACDEALFTFTTTDELTDSGALVGQEQLLEALSFGTGIRRQGFNIYMMAPETCNRHTLVRRFLAGRAEAEPVPADLCYVHGFEEATRPELLVLPAGVGRRFRASLDKLVEELLLSIPAIFETEEYHNRLDELNQQLAERQSTAMSEIKALAEAEEVALINTPTGFTLAPKKDGDVLDAKHFRQLPETERLAMEQAIERVEARLQEVLQQFPQWKRETQQHIQWLNEEMVMFAGGNLIDELRTEYAGCEPAIHHLEAIQQDLSGNVNLLLAHMREGELPAHLLTRYRLNLLVDNADTQGAPVVYEDWPSLVRLLGRVEHHVEQGALITDFTLIRAGALHKANGGYLILDVQRLLQQPMVWEVLKRALYAEEIRIESLERFYSLASTVSLEPEPVPLELKVILIGDRRLYYLLAAYDPDFGKLFKVQADYNDDIEVSSESLQRYARFIGWLARQQDLRPLTRCGVARMIEYAGRLADDQQRLSALTEELTDVLQEANYLTESESQAHINGEAVERALSAGQRRAARIHRRMEESILRGSKLIDTQDAVVGQVNGLTVLDLGNYRFGQPARITATARLGTGSVLDIEREVKLSGAVHAKAMLILSRFLSHRYAAEGPMPVSASLAFEQSYGMIEGDSASIAECCALISAMGEVPINQALAVTGSINQFGRVQPIGGVNEKIEGFFEVCRARGLAPGQGVIIPAANTDNLMLNREVRKAVAEGQFRVYTVSTLDEALALLTGMEVGEVNARGDFPANSVNGRVQQRLARLAEVQRKLHRHDDDQDDAGEKTS
ncbi:AAA family ATPase [Oceanimonas sp. CHS3-5]|uniref:Lon protease family protein n=1 Tax=Oceanimonas sp. CHS3-5 TaxID=3068186 RepID=UPI00273FE261|nr:AAA family ATPase [Oceanimonas sp. CHS3-5]MDP5292699.1 AAA family ATPase [Oceanimonas sp. CHS3-5]